jgi:hypothetical protein
MAGVLGNPRNLAEAGELGREAQVAAADEFAAKILPALNAFGWEEPRRWRRSAGLSINRE